MIELAIVAAGVILLTIGATALVGPLALVVIGAALVVVGLVVDLERLK